MAIDMSIYINNNILLTKKLAHNHKWWAYVPKFLFILFFFSFRSRHTAQSEACRPQVAEVALEDPYKHNYDAPYTGEPDYASWINQRSLPQLSVDSASVKRDVQIVKPVIAQERGLNTLPRQNKSELDYECPQYIRKDSSPLH